MLNALPWFNNVRVQFSLSCSVGFHHSIALFQYSSVLHFTIPPFLLGHNNLPKWKGTHNFYLFIVCTRWEKSLLMYALLLGFINFTFLWDTLLVAWFNISCQAKSRGDGEDGSSGSSETSCSARQAASCVSATRIISFEAACWLFALSYRAAALLDNSCTYRHACIH